MSNLNECLDLKRQLINDVIEAEGLQVRGAKPGPNRGRLLVEMGTDRPDFRAPCQDVGFRKMGPCTCGREGWGWGGGGGGGGSDEKD